MFIVNFKISFWEQVKILSLIILYLGTHYFKSGKYDLAIKLYKRIQSFVENDTDKETATQRQALLLASHLNIALCQLKLKDYFEAKSASNAALKLDPNNEKALFRRGQAYLNLGEAQLAKNDFTRCLELDPNNSATKAQLAACTKTLKEMLQKEKTVSLNHVRIGIFLPFLGYKGRLYMTLPWKHFFDLRV